MAMTLVQIQAMITNKEEPRQILNELADYLQANPGGGGGSEGVALESYQNSAMSAPVMAYVFRDSDDNIFRVYEPIRNNDVSRKSFAYADSIDRFPFDDANFYNNTLSDVKIVDLGFFEINSSVLKNIIIDGNGAHTGLTIYNSFWQGNNGSDTLNGAELFLDGDNVQFDGMTILPSRTGVTSTCFDSPGDTSQFRNCTIGGNCDFRFNGNTFNFLDSTFHTYVRLLQNANDCQITDILIKDGADITFNVANKILTEGEVGAYSQLIIGGSIEKCNIGLQVDVDTTNGALTRCSIADNLTYAPEADKTDVQIINVGGVAYVLGEAAAGTVGTSDAMDAGTVTVLTSKVTANSKIFLTHAVPAGTLGWLSPGTIVPGVSFVINSTGATDLSTVNWLIIN